ncbi:MAG: UDP-N-acetylmuramoyl-L-alanine--D-glutamate ligase [Saprospiraceae bacterium]
MIIILGCGESGFGAALLAQAQGLKVFVSDGSKIRETFRKELIEREIDFEEEGHSIIYDCHPELVIQSPGIPDVAEPIQFFKEKKIAIISEIEFAFRYCTGKIIAITGSNGKTTTTNLTHHILVTAGLDAVKVGNVGVSFCRSLAAGAHQYYVVEVSSFQLDTTDRFQPDIAVILNITPDHLDRYGHDMGRYAAAKFRIAKNQHKENHLILYRDAGIERYVPSMVLDGPQIHWVETTMDDSENVSINGETRFQLQHARLKGRHNAMNLACAAAACSLLGITDEIIQRAVDSFVNDAHRLELIDVINGVQYVNDSKATNVDSVYWALDAMRTSIIWIAGGQDKGNDYTVIDPLVKTKVRALIALGKDNSKLLQHYEGIVPVFDTHAMEDAVRIGRQQALEGDVVLLSPACASFDLFSNYIHRGNEFRTAVMKLKTEYAA